MINLIFPYLVPILVAIAVSGCGTMKAYDGPSLSNDQIAVITKCDPPFCFVWDGNEGFIHAVDGREKSVLDDRVKVLPGRHEIDVQIIVDRGYGIAKTGERKLVLNAEAGHTYRVHGFAPASAWIIDMETKEVVAGYKR